MSLDPDVFGRDVDQAKRPAIGTLRANLVPVHAERIDPVAPVNTAAAIQDATKMRVAKIIEIEDELAGVSQRQVIRAVPEMLPKFPSPGEPPRRKHVLSIATPDKVEVAKRVNDG